MKKLCLVISFLLAYCHIGMQAQNVQVPRDTSYTILSTYLHNKKYHPEIEPARQELPKGVTAYEDVVYTTLHGTPYGDRELRLNVYRPSDKKRRPALIMVHGGGWNSGDKSLQVPMAMAIAAKGYVTIAVEYRLRPEAVYPAALHDLKTAVRWARAHAAQYGIDTTRIAMSGCSAGGHLATLVGMTNGSARHEGNGEWAQHSSDIQAVVSMDGCSTFISRHNIEDTEERMRRQHKMPLTAQWLGGLYEDARENWIEASPVAWVSQRSAPVCFINSQLPRYSDGKEELIGKLDTYGIYHEVHKHDAPLHTFWFFHPWFTPTVEYTVHFLDTVFKRGG
ncbi:MAG: alpha/beta hydrolase [Prevotella sp.]|nr:alpha/beta hydrolase [Prevotella sp.]